MIQPSHYLLLSVLFAHGGHHDHHHPTASGGRAARHRADAPGCEPGVRRACQLVPGLGRNRGALPSLSWPLCN